MSKPVTVVVDYRTHHRDMQETINRALPRRNPILGLLIGFACTIVIAWAAFSLLIEHFGRS